ncbi:MAG: DNA polymerase IV [Ruminococcaceae bacterium]|nr:DNA polymerase IV [Oscillospiraceae bacterium]
MKNYYDFEEYENYYKNRDFHFERVILHSDLNNFFASVESLKDPSLKNVPFAVCGDPEKRHGIVLAKNEIAKRFNVRTGDTIREARRKCTNIIIGEAHYKDYIKYSKIVNEIYLSYATRVEPFGIDESWIDITEISHRNCPENPFLAGVKIANEIRERVKRETGLTISVGVSFNKTFSKFASDLKKPDAVSEISPKDFKKIVWKFPVDALLFVGKRTKDALKLLKIERIGDLALQSRHTLKENLGKFGETLWDTSNGFDISPVEFYHGRGDSKSISNSVTLPIDITAFEQASSVVISLVSAICEELRDRNIKCSIVKIYVKYSNFTTFTRQIKLETPAFDYNTILEECKNLFLKNVDWSLGVRTLGIGVDGLTSFSGEQLSFFTCREDSLPLDNALGNIRKKYGDEIIQRGSVLKYQNLCDFDKKHPAFNNNIN